MRSVAVYLTLAAVGMSTWAWAVLSAQARFFHLAILVVMAACCLGVDRLLQRHTKDRKEEAVKRIRTWTLLTVAATITLIVGNRLAEGAGLDPDNQPSGR